MCICLFIQLNIFLLVLFYFYFFKLEDHEKTALVLLCKLLCVQPKNRPDEDNQKFLIVQYEVCSAEINEFIFNFNFLILLQMSTDPESVGNEISSRNTPFIAEFNGDDCETVYFLYVEQFPLCSTCSFTKALYLWFSFYYIFNLEYAKILKDLCLFFQEFIFGLPDNCIKKTSTYLSVSTDIQAYTLH